MRNKEEVEKPFEGDREGVPEGCINTLHRFFFFFLDSRDSSADILFSLQICGYFYRIFIGSLINSTQ